MNEQQLNIAIAKWMGWQEEHDPYPSFETGEMVQWWKFNAASVETSRLPQYVSDLNAMASAEAKLSKEQWTEYELALIEITYSLTDATPAQINRVLIHATALQRATALAKALNLAVEP